MIVFDSIISVSSNSGGGGGSNDILTTSEYLILIFLAMIFAAALFSSRTKVPYTMGLVGIGIAISLFLGLARGEVGGLNILDFNRLDPKLIIDFIIPPLIFEAMMKVDYYNEFKAIRVSALLLSTAGVVIATVKKEADMSLKVRTAVFNFWEMTAFFANSAAFLYLGISMNILRIAENIPSVALSFVAVLVARAVSTCPILAATNRLTREKNSCYMEACCHAWRNEGSDIRSIGCIDTINSRGI